MKSILFTSAMTSMLSAGMVTAQTQSSPDFDAALISSESTISPEIQAKVTEILTRSISDLEASAGSVIVMEAKSGNIVALVALDGDLAADEP